LLFVTKLPSFAILWGKLLASMSFVLLLLLLSVPIFSLVFLFGGIELDQVAAAFLVTAISALTLGIIGIACSTAFRRTLPATVTAYGAAFILLAGSLLFGLLFPTDIDPKATAAPAPPAVTYLSPLIPLITIGTNGPITNFGVRTGGPLYGTSGSSTTTCSITPGGLKSCYQAGPTGPIGKGIITAYQAQASGTVIPSGLFAGWQYWQATVTLQLAICLVALIVGAMLIPPVRHLPWRRRATVQVKP
jgi:ABC-type transport system involved in multi-copper enzyme maturation permease subunit